MMDEHLKALLDYTVFHIGVYLTMGGAIVAADVIWHKHAKHLTVVLLLLLLAGAAGGTVASNIPSAKGITIEEFLKEWPVVFLGVTIPVTNGILTQVEHGAFWAAIAYMGRLFYLHSKGLSPFGSRETIKSRMDRLIEFVIMYPFLENTHYINSWKLSTRDDRSIQYRHYCFFAFNLIADLWEHCKGDPKKMHEILAFKELLFDHRQWWVDDPDNKTGYGNPQFHDFVKTEIEKECAIQGLPSPFPPPRPTSPPPPTPPSPSP